MHHKWLPIMLVAVLWVYSSGQRSAAGDMPKQANGAADAPRRNAMIPVRILIGDSVFAAQLHDTASTRVLLDHMPFTVEMQDHAGQEKVVQLPYSFPAATTEQPVTIEAGELYLWSTDRLVLFYKTFRNSFGGYIPLGYIEDTTILREVLGDEMVTVTFSR